MYAIESNIPKAEIEDSVLIDFIEQNKLNISYEYGGNTGIGEPWNDLDDMEVESPSLEFLNDNYDSVLKAYLKLN